MPQGAGGVAGGGRRLGEAQQAQARTVAPAGPTTGALRMCAGPLLGWVDGAGIFPVQEGEPWPS